MSNFLRTSCSGAKNFFPLPNAIFTLGLSAGELAVYAYLMFCEDRKSYQCWPSYKTIGIAVGMSENTVRKYVRELEYKKMSVDIGGGYVVVLVVRKGAKIWQNAEQMVRATYASARMAAGRGGTRLAAILSQAR